RLERELDYAVERHGFMMRLREADEELVARERRFRSLVEHSSDLTLMLDPGGRVIYASPSVHRTFGHIRPGQSYLSLLGRGGVKKAQAAFDMAVKHPERAVPLTVETRAEEGEVRTLEGTITDLGHYEGVSAIVINLHDATLRVKAMEQALSERNNKKALIDSSKDLIWSVDRNYNIIEANQWFIKSVESMGGTIPVVGTSILPLIQRGNFKDGWAAYLERALAGESFMIEEQSEGPQPIWGEFSFNP